MTIPQHKAVTALKDFYFKGHPYQAGQSLQMTEREVKIYTSLGYINPVSVLPIATDLHPVQALISFYFRGESIAQGSTFSMPAKAAYCYIALGYVKSVQSISRQTLRISIQPSTLRTYNIPPYNNPSQNIVTMPALRACA